MHYSLRELECFTAVAEHRSFTRAARALHLAQPPLSRHVRSLEEKIGTALFVRSKRGITLTSTGALFYEETRQVLPQLMRAGEAARRAALGQTARLRLGFVSAVVSPELVHWLRAFRETCPDVRVSMEDAPPADQLAALERGTLDGGFVGLRPVEQARGIDFVPWQQEPLACFVPSGHRLARRSSLAPRELAGEPLIAVSRDSAPAFAAFIAQVCRTAGFRPRIVQESPRAQSVVVMVAAGAGLALLPVSLARVAGDAAVAVPLAPTQAITHVFARRSGPSSDPLRAFLALGRKRS